MHSATVRFTTFWAAVDKTVQKSIPNISVKAFESFKSLVLDRRSIDFCFYGLSIILF